MKNRMLSLMLALALAAGLAVPAFAALDSPYGLYVAGLPVTAANAADVFGDGTVRYDDAANTLYLTDATIQGGEDHGINYTGTGHLKIHGTGTNSITSDQVAIHQRNGALTLTGSFDRIAGTVGGIAGFYMELDVTIPADTYIRALSGDLLAGRLIMAGTIDTAGRISCITGEISGTIGVIRPLAKPGTQMDGIRGDDLRISGTIGLIDTPGNDTGDSAYGIWADNSLQITGAVEIRSCQFAIRCAKRNSTILTLPEGYSMRWGIPDDQSDIPHDLLYKDGEPAASVVLERVDPPVAAIPMYWPALNQAPGGTVKASPLAGSEGAAMNLLVHPADGMVLEQLIVTDAEGQRIAVQASGDHRWSFVQPASGVTVTPVFAHADPLECFAKTNSEAFATRAELAELLWRMEGKPMVNYLMQFSDVKQTDARAEAIRWAAAQKLMLGHGDGSFRPNEAITRQEAVTVLYRWIQARGGGFTGMWMFLLQHPDRMDLADWAYEAACWTTMHDILPCPDGNLRPADPITRAELAEMVHKTEG